MKQSYLKSLMTYDAATGVFVWINPPWNHPRMAGKKAGSQSTGYELIRIDGKKYKAHRLAWLYVTGRMPKNEIDHMDGDPFNNKFNNLRECTHVQNQANSRRFKNKALPKGVRANGRKYTARITFRGKVTTIGTFDSIQEASNAYFSEASRLYGDFARRD